MSHIWQRMVGPLDRSSASPTRLCFVSAVEPFGGRIIQTDLDEDDIKALRKALKRA